MAMVAAGLANGGTVMKPYIVDEQQSADLDVLDKTEPQELSKAVSSTTASEVTKLMVATVADGTASPAQIPGIDVAGRPAPPRAGSTRCRRTRGSSVRAGRRPQGRRGRDDPEGGHPAR